MRANRFLLSAAIVASSALVSASAPSEKTVLPFIEDDYARAVSEARAKKLPIFIEAWAPW